MCLNTYLFFFNATPTTETYTLSLHDALPIFYSCDPDSTAVGWLLRRRIPLVFVDQAPARSEEHTSELQSHVNLVCRLLLEKKKLKNYALEFHRNYTRSAAHTQEPESRARLVE